MPLETGETPHTYYSELSGETVFPLVDLDMYFYDMYVTPFEAAAYHSVLEAKELYNEAYAICLVVGSQHSLGENAVQYLIEKSRELWWHRFSK